MKSTATHPRPWRGALIVSHDVFEAPGAHVFVNQPSPSGWLMTTIKTTSGMPDLLAGIVIRQAAGWLRIPPAKATDDAAFANGLGNGKNHVRVCYGSYRQAMRLLVTRRAYARGVAQPNGVNQRQK